MKRMTNVINWIRNTLIEVVNIFNVQNNNNNKVMIEDLQQEIGYLKSSIHRLQISNHHMTNQIKELNDPNNILLPKDITRNLKIREELCEIFGCSFLYSKKRWRKFIMMIDQVRLNRIDDHNTANDSILRSLQKLNTETAIDSDLQLSISRAPKVTSCRNQD